MEESEECSTFGDLRIHEGPTALTWKQDPGDRCLFMVAGAILQWFYQKDDLFREKTMFSISSLEKAMFHPGAYKLLVFCFSR